MQHNRVYIWVLGILLFLSPTVLLRAQSAPSAKEEIDYGEMYVIEQRTTIDKAWQVAAGYGYGFSNPYLNIQSLQLDIARQFNHYTVIGVEPSFQFTNYNRVTDALSSELGAQGIRSKIYRPHYGVHGFVGLIPLSGTLNWFSSSSVPFDLLLTVGLGVAKYHEMNSITPSFRLGITPQFMVSKAIGFQAGIQGKIEELTGSDWQNRIESVVSVVSRF